MNHDNPVKPVPDKVPTEVAYRADTLNAPDAMGPACNPATIQASDPVVQSSDGTTYWQLQNKTDPTRNVWVSGCKGLCDTPDAAIRLARDCKECLEGEWNIINCNTYENWRNIHERTRQRILH